MTKKQKRLALILGGVGAAGVALALVLTALNSTITYFYTPSDLTARAAAPDRPIRLGGLVMEGSVEFGESEADAEGSLVSFEVTDGVAALRVTYAGILPDLFREGQGVVVQGRLTPDRSMLIADTVLAKHDENYMPKEVADALKEKGHWQPDDAGS
ncbi:MAG: cytochrome c maturation protein CcmE [Parvularculaceae bacterium]